MQILDARLTAEALPWEALFAAVQATIRDANAGHAGSPPRMSVPLGDGAVWLLMPALSSSADIGACKLITVHGSNRERHLPSIQGDILVIRASTGERLALLDGPTVTARRTAAVTTLAVRRILEARTVAATVASEVASASITQSSEPTSCLIIGCGVQGRSHLEALHAAYPALQFLLCSRTAASARALAEYATNNGIPARTVPSPEAVLPKVDLVVCCTDASAICLNQPPRQGAIIAAIGSFKPEMSELSPAVMQVIGRNILLDSADAGHEAGELIQNGIDPEGLPNLFTWHPQALPAVMRTVLFKSCGNALWDLAAAQAATAG